MYTFRPVSALILYVIPCVLLCLAAPASDVAPSLENANTNENLTARGRTFDELTENGFQKVVRQHKGASKIRVENVKARTSVANTTDAKKFDDITLHIYVVEKEAQIEEWHLSDSGIFSTWKLEKTIPYSYMRADPLFDLQDREGCTLQKVLDRAVSRGINRDWTTVTLKVVKYRKDVRDGLYYILGGGTTSREWYVNMDGQFSHVDAADGVPEEGAGNPGVPTS